MRNPFFFPSILLFAAFILLPAPARAQTSQNLICICNAAPALACQNQPDDPGGIEANRRTICNSACSGNVREIVTTRQSCAEYCTANPTVCVMSSPSPPPAPATADNRANTVQLANPLGEGRTDLRAIIGEVIKKVLTILGSVTLLVFIAGGVMWLTSGGSEEKVAKGSKTMLYAAIGIAVIFAAYAILNTVIRTLTGAS